MNYRLSNFIIFFLFLFSINLKGQEECKQILVNYLDEMSIPDIPEEGQVYYLHALYEYDFFEKYDVKDFKSEVKAYISKDQSVYETPQLSYYGDSTDLFVIHHAMNKIIWTDGVPNTKTNLQKMDIVEIQKKLIDMGTISYCKKIRVDRRKYKKIDLSFNKDVQEETHVKKMSFSYDIKAKALKEMWVFFTDDQKMRSQKITINTIEFDYKNWNPVPVKDLIFNKNGSLNSKFSYYHLINNKN